MKIIINGNNNKWKDIQGNKANIRYLPYNKISNIYMVNYNLLLNILNKGPIFSFKNKVCYTNVSTNKCETF